MGDEGSSGKYIIQQGDLVYFYVDTNGFFAIPSQNEPLAEHNDTVSHLRAITSPSKQIPSDFNQRYVL
jgi:hypothetical protein